MFSRSLEPEWLDHLPGDDPRAVASRRDLRLVNRIMGHARIIGRVLRERLTGETPRVAELGAGDGTLLARIAAAARWKSGADIVLVDRQPVVSAATGERYRESGCRLSIDAADVFDWLARASDRYDAIVANLFMHHFDAPALARLFELAAARTGLLVACEPRRARLPLAGSHLLGLIGCNDVTRHDAVLSVRAGFSGEELSALWPAGTEWTLEERRAGLFSHLFSAYRSPA
jgi:SAM-dependent methyltransferase